MIGIEWFLKSGILSGDFLRTIYLAWVLECWIVRGLFANMYQWALSTEQPMTERVYFFDGLVDSVGSIRAPLSEGIRDQ